MTEDRLRSLTDHAKNIIVPSGDVIDLVRNDTPGILHSIEVITDNAYAAIYLELDEYRTKEPGITAAELLMKGRTERNEDEFYAQSITQDGSYVVRFEPEKPIPYSKRLLVQVRNRIAPSNEIYGATRGQFYAPRGGLPTPQYLSFTGGGYIKNANITSVHHNAAAKFLRVNMDEYHSGVINTKPLVDDETIVGVSHPYAGISGAVRLEIGPDGPMNRAGSRLVIASPGETVLPDDPSFVGLLSGDESVTYDRNPWPGIAKQIAGDDGNAQFDADSNSKQQIVIYPSKAEDRAETGLANTFGALLFARQGVIRIFIKEGDTIYFPGRLHRIYAFDTTAVDTDGDADPRWIQIDNYSPGEHGAIMLEVQPGCPALPRKMTLGSALSSSGNLETTGVPTNSLGVIMDTDNIDGGGYEPTGRFLVREATVKRKTLVSNT